MFQVLRGEAVCFDIAEIINPANIQVGIVCDKIVPKLFTPIDTGGIFH